MFKLGTLVKDSATGLKGMLTHLQVEMDGLMHYLFQPKGLNPENGHPVPKLWLVDSRIENGELTHVQLPTEVLGTEVEDIASGFKGTAISLVLHVSGCVHVNVQPKGVLAKTGGPIEPMDFDIRRLKGNRIPKLTEEAREKDQKKKPSPGGYGAPCGIADGNGTRWVR